MFRFLLPVFCIALPWAAWGADSGKIASLNLCTDQLALAWLPKERLAGVSFNAADTSISLLAEEAKDVPLLRGSQEEILQLAPERVLLGGGQNTYLRRWLAETDIPVMTLGTANALAAVQEDMYRFAQALGAGEQAEQVMAEQEQALTESRFPAELRVAVYYLRGFSDGQGTLLDELITRLGGVNIAAENGKDGMQHISLEALLAAQPDIILIPRYGYGGQEAGDVTQHPALLASGARLVYLPGAYFTCPHLAVAPLVRAMGQVVKEKHE